MISQLRNAKDRLAAALPGKAYKPIAAAVVVLAAGASSAMATPVTVPVIDLGFEATDITTNLQGYLVPFLVAAISVSFAFWAILKGVRWIKGMIGG